MSNATLTNADLAALLADVLGSELPQPTLASVWARVPRIDLQFSESDEYDIAALNAWASRYGGHVVSGRRNRSGQVPLTLDFTHNGVGFHAYAYIKPGRLA